MPHVAVVDCIRANAEEIRQVLNLSKRLLRKRSELMAQRHAAAATTAAAVAARPARKKQTRHT